MPGFLLDSDDEDGMEERSEAAWRIARALAARHPSTTWPDLPPGIPDHLTQLVRAALNEVYFYGLLIAATEAVLTAGRDGLALTLPPLQGTDGFDASRRHISWETLLPFVDQTVAPDVAVAMAHRLRGLARICDNYAASAKKNRT